MNVFKYESETLCPGLAVTCKVLIGYRLSTVKKVVELGTNRNRAEKLCNDDEQVLV